MGRAGRALRRLVAARRTTPGRRPAGVVACAQSVDQTAWTLFHHSRLPSACASGVKPCFDGESGRRVQRSLVRDRDQVARAVEARRPRTCQLCVALNRAGIPQARGVDDCCSARFVEGVHGHEACRLCRGSKCDQAHGNAQRAETAKADLSPGQPNEVTSLQPDVYQERTLCRRVGRLLGHDQRIVAVLRK